MLVSIFFFKIVFVCHFKPGLLSIFSVIQTSAQQRIARTADTPIAFYAYSSHTFPRPSDHFILNFDTIITNLGNGITRIPEHLSQLGPDIMSLRGPLGFKVMLIFRPNSW